MTSQLSKIVFGLILVGGGIFAGCGQEHKRQKFSCEAKVSFADVVPDYVSGAIEATGGREEWIKTTKIASDCVVTFYRQDDSYYLTEQRYEICPWANSIRISAQEPEGKFLWQLFWPDFAVLEGPHTYSILPETMSNRHFAEAVLNITTAPIRFLDGSAKFSKEAQPVKIEGQWYYPIEKADSDISDYRETYWSEVIFYQNKDSSLVDMIWFIEAKGQNSLAVRGYDYKQVEKDGAWLPTRIEIFKAGSDGFLQERLVKINFGE